ncbi:efflux RND transporter periplasmic adaptor subunit [Dasania marina]|uniref:efflux RND transporter periplasmic adaptor subunit n=1 Tax=Dasania marina TaxID=471499 RepID=UPI0003772F6D|nr:efflux RND transporter periplasmic adaptor subunit [Dasania marina]
MPAIDLSQLLLAIALSFNIFFAVASGDDHHDEGVVISPQIAAKSGIKTASAGPGDIHQTLSVYGKVVADADLISHIRARFPGTIATAKANIGDVVSKGDVLAEVESNESLRRYALTAPLSGMVTDRHATVGESTADQTLFTVANFDCLWAELQVFPSQLQSIAVGQQVSLNANMNAKNNQALSVIKHLIPNDTGSAFVLARVPIDNRNGEWTPGMLLEAKVSILREAVPLVVANSAIQQLEGRPVVFVKEGDSYKARPVTLGRADEHYNEVLAGLNIGEDYVIANSYLIKADLQKSGAEHQH